MQHLVSRKSFFALFVGAASFGTAKAAQAATVSTNANLKLVMPPPPQPPPPKNKWTPLQALKPLVVVPNAPKGPDLQSQINALNARVYALEGNQTYIFGKLNDLYANVNTVGTQLYNHNHRYFWYNAVAGQWQTWGTGYADFY